MWPPRCWELSASCLPREKTATTRSTTCKPRSNVGPTDPQLKGELDQLVEIFSGPVSSGTGWVCAAGGYLMTNNHVVEGPGKIFVRIPGQPHEALAEIVATDPQRDVAIIHVLDGAADQMKPLTISDKPVGRAAEVAAFGYPLGDELGGGLKFTKGAITLCPPLKTRACISWTWKSIRETAAGRSATSAVRSSASWQPRAFPRAPCKAMAWPFPVKRPSPICKRISPAASNRRRPKR